MRQPRTERLAPQHRIASVARMTEVKRIRHFGDVAAHQFGVAAIAVASEHKRATADRLAAAIARHHLDAFYEALVVRVQRLGDAAAENWDIARLHSAA